VRAYYSRYHITSDKKHHISRPRSLSRVLVPAKPKMVLNSRVGRGTIVTSVHLRQPGVVVIAMIIYWEIYFETMRRSEYHIVTGAPMSVH